MASNPMQRKSRNSFLIGMVVTLFITGVIIAILLLQLGKMKNAEEQEILQRVNVYTLNQDVKSSQVLTEDMFQIKSVNKDTVPADATSDEKVIKTWFLQTKEGEMIHTDAHGLYLKRTIEQNNGIIEVIQNKNIAFKDVNGEVIEKEEYYTFVNGEAKRVTTGETNFKQDEFGAYFIDEKNEDEKTRVWQEEKTGEYYIYVIDSSTMNAGANKTRKKEYLEINNVPILAKVAMNANTVITPNLIIQSDEILTDDTRKQEYNMVILPVDLMTDDYVDIRLMTPGGQDFIVISKVRVDIPMNSVDTVRVNLREDEILSMSSAIVEAYGLIGSKLYATKYVEPAMQEASLPTYTPNAAVTAQIDADGDGRIDNPNIVEDAMKEIKTRYLETAKKARNEYLQSLINTTETYKENVQTRSEEDIVAANAARQKYLESLFGGSEEDYEE